MAGKKNDKGEPVGWVTIKGVHFPKWADGSIGWENGTEKKDFKTMKKEAKADWDYEHNNPEGLSREYFSKSPEERQKIQEELAKKERKLPAELKGRTPTEFRKLASKNERYDTSRVGKKKPTALEAFKENSRQLNVALEEGTRQNALEVHYTDMTGKLYKMWWNGAKFTADKIKQDMAKKYGKKAGIYKASFKKPKEWE